MVQKSHSQPPGIAGWMYKNRRKLNGTYYQPQQQCFFAGFLNNKQCIPHCFDKGYFFWRPKKSGLFVFGDFWTESTVHVVLQGRLPETAIAPENQGAFLGPGLLTGAMLTLGKVICFMALPPMPGQWILVTIKKSPCLGRCSDLHHEIILSSNFALIFLPYKLATGTKHWSKTSVWSCFFQSSK